MDDTASAPPAKVATDRWVGVIEASRIAEVSPSSLYLLAGKKKVRTKSVAGRLLFERTSLERYRAAKAAA